MLSPMAETTPGLVLDRERLDRALEVAQTGEFEWDLVRNVFRVGDRMAALTGLPPGEIAADVTERLFAHVHPDDRARVEEVIATAIRSGSSYKVDYRAVRGDDQRTVWLRAVGYVAKDADGKPQAICGLARDITEERTVEDQHRNLMAELDHRVKNVLAAVQTLAFQTAKRTTSLESFLANFAGRLKSMAAANELLTAARWRGAAISHLAAAELGGIAPGQTRWDGPELFLTPRAANALALALHELTTNALKYGALSAELGRVDLHWRRTADGGFELTWTESGGPAVTPPSHVGFGSTLLAQVTGRELNGGAVVEYRAAGVRARLRAGPAAVVDRPETVPEAPARRDPDATPAGDEPPNLKGARVLIVEDAVLLALELETGLSEAGAAVVGPAYELEEALALLGGEIDAAVLDANLNGRSVTPVAEALAKRGVPFVFATGYGDAGGAPTGFDAPIIRKPYDVTQVAAAVAGVLNR